MIFLVFFEYFGDTYGVYVSIKSEHFGSSRNHLTSIAIGPESLISHFGIFKPHEPHHKYIKKLIKTTNSLIFHCIFVIRPCFWTTLLIPIFFLRSPNMVSDRNLADQLYSFRSDRSRTLLSTLFSRVYAGLQKMVIYRLE